MTIKELIEELSKYNEELEVLIETSESDEIGLEPRIVLTHMKRGGPGCLNRISASISGASAGVRLPSGGAAG
jgi:hypothetical protein